MFTTYLIFLIHVPPPPVTLRPKAGHGHFCGFYITHNDTPQLIRLLWTSDQFVAKTTHNSHNRHPCLMSGFEPAIPTSERPQTHELDRAVTDIGFLFHTIMTISNIFWNIFIQHPDIILLFLQESLHLTC